MSDNSKEEEKKKFTPGELRQVIGSQCAYKFIAELSGFAFRPFEKKDAE